MSVAGKIDSAVKTLTDISLSIKKLIGKHDEAMPGAEHDAMPDMMSDEE